MKKNKQLSIEDSSEVSPTLGVGNNGMVLIAKVINEEIDIVQRNKDVMTGIRELNEDELIKFMDNLLIIKETVDPSILYSVKISFPNPICDLLGLETAKINNVSDHLSELDDYLKSIIQ